MSNYFLNLTPPVPIYINNFKTKYIGKKAKRKKKNNIPKTHQTTIKLSITKYQSS